MDPIKKIFLQEANDLLENLDALLLDLEESPESAPLQREFMRTAHTFKGSAGTAGLSLFADLGHEIEDFVDHLRQGKIAGSPEFFDKLSHSLQALYHGLAFTARTENEPPELETTRLELQNWLEEAGAGREKRSEKKVATAHFAIGEYDRIRLKMIEKKGAELLAISLSLAESAADPVETAIEMLTRLRKAGDVVATNPAEAELDKLKERRTFDVLFGSSMHAANLRELLASDEIAKVAIGPYVVEESKRKSADEEQLLQPIVTDKTVRIEMEVLDQLLRLVGELMINRSRFEQIAEEFDAGLGDPLLAAEIDDAAERLGHLTSDLQGGIMRARMVPVARIFRSMKRMARDRSRELGKPVRLTVSGEQTELDKKLVDSLTEPLSEFIGVLANCAEAAAAGEAALMQVKAERRGNQVFLLFEGKGARPPKEELARTSVAMGQAGGRMEDQSPSGGFAFHIALPVTLAIIPVMMVETADEIYAFPLESVKETLKIGASLISTVEGRAVTELRGEAVSLLFLDRALGKPRAEQIDDFFVVVVEHGDRPIGIAVDRLLGKREIVIKPLSSKYFKIQEISGSAILGDGRVALILDAGSLIDNSSHVAVC